MTAQTTKVYMKQGGDEIVIAGADGGKLLGVSVAGGAPAQAAAISDVSASPSPSNDELATAIDSILAALRAAGIIASS